jgi:hypothetical protein
MLTVNAFRSLVNEYRPVSTVGVMWHMLCLQFDSKFTLIKANLPHLLAENITETRTINVHSAPIVANIMTKKTSMENLFSTSQSMI